MLQATFGELADVHPYRFRVDDLEQPDIGWYVTPGIPNAACECELCVAARAGRDLYLGSISRVAHIRAGAIVRAHLAAAT